MHVIIHGDSAERIIAQSISIFQAIERRTHMTFFSPSLLNWYFVQRNMHARELLRICNNLIRFKFFYFPLENKILYKKNFYSIFFDLFL